MLLGLSIHDKKKGKFLEYEGDSPILWTGVDCSYVNLGLGWRTKNSDNVECRSHIVSGTWLPEHSYT